MTGRRFAAWLAGLAAFGLVLRLVYALVVVRDDPLIGDALQFHNFANLNADGRFFVHDRLFLEQGIERPTADKPPLYPLLLTAASLLGGRSWQAHQVVGCLVGAATIVAIGLLARRVAGPRVGLLAAAMAAVSPLLVATDGSLRSESPYALLVALVLLAAVRVRERPTAGAAAAFGAVVGLAALTRGEAVLLLALIGLPLLAPLGRAGWARLGVATAVMVAVLAPWLARSWIAFDRPVAISTNTGGLIAGANCDQTYRGPLLGQWVYDCVRPAVHVNEALEAAHQRAEGLRYAREHASRLPAVVGARLGRSFDVYRPRQGAALMAFFEGRNGRVAEASVAWWYALVVLGVVGAVVLRRRRGPVWILLAPVVVLVVVSATAYGWTRFRAGVEPGALVLAAVGLAALWPPLRARAAALRGRRRTGVA
jgi:4-amino-4-deoxy-L-arabinose transferase-like glycosyltransferase